MEMELTAKTEKGKQALERMYHDSKELRARAVSKINIISNEPFTLSFRLKVLSPFPNTVKNNPQIWGMLTDNVSKMMREYGATDGDYEVS